MQLAIDTPCTLCPRSCGVARDAGRGFCGAPHGLEVAAVCLHRGEEPPLVGGGDGAPDEALRQPRGMVNVFFAHCNLQCAYCQNHAVSSREVDPALVRFRSVEAVAERICQLLPQSCGLLGFVTAAHYLHHLPALLDAVHRRGFHPVVVYNSSGYESPDALRSLEGLVDIYLPDLKYMDPALAQAYSHAPDYPDVARAALLEMRRQVGPSLKVADGVAYRGMVVRHLVLPGAVDNSLRCLDWLASDFDPCGRTCLSLMAQYFPPQPDRLPQPLRRTLRPEEYDQVVRHAEQLGLTRGWVQQLEATSHYRPDFSRTENPFE